MSTVTNRESRSDNTIKIAGGLVVGRVGYGAMQLTGPQVWGEYPDRDGAIALLRHVADAGVTLIDTADVYGPHSNELLIHDALHPYPSDLVIATKGGFVRGGFDYSTLDAIGNRNYLRQSAHMSARRLGVETIDLYYLHSGRAIDAPFEDQIATLAELRDQGVIRHIGLSNVSVEQFEAARATSTRTLPLRALTSHSKRSSRSRSSSPRPERLARADATNHQRSSTRFSPRRVRRTSPCVRGVAEVGLGLGEDLIGRPP
jgi:aryl-alcohol dehydrogenase-like predicted oxidoreductase